MNPETHFCSFCGKSQHEVAQLIAGPSVFIDEFVELTMPSCSNIDRKTAEMPLGGNRTSTAYGTTWT